MALGVLTIPKTFGFEAATQLQVKQLTNSSMTG